MVVLDEYCNNEVSIDPSILEPLFIHPDERRKDSRFPEESRAKLKTLIWPQVWVTLFVDIAPYLAGLSTGFQGIFLPDIRSDLHATIEQGSWIAGTVGIGGILGCLLSAFTCERYGRKRTLQICTIPFLVGYIIIIFSNNVLVICIGRSLTGIGIGVMTGITQVYLSEVCDVQHRGLFSSTPMTMTNFGSVSAHVMALMISWRSVAAIGALISATALVLLFFIPETPTWLVMKERKKEAEHVLKKMRGTECDIYLELDEIIEKYHENKVENIKSRDHWTKLIRLFFSAQTMKAFGILFVIFLTQSFSGSMVLTGFMENIFERVISEQFFDVKYVIIIAGSVQVLLDVISNFVLKSVRKKPLYAITGTGVAVSLISLGAFYYISNENSNSNYDWVPGLFICLFYIFETPGFFLASWVLIGELFPQRTRGTISSIFPIIGSVLHFIVIKTYPDLLFAVESFGLFWIYGTVALIGTILIVIILPETEDLTLTEIEYNLTIQQKKCCWENCSFCLRKAAK